MLVLHGSCAKDVQICMAIQYDAGNLRFVRSGEDVGDKEGMLQMAAEVGLPVHL